MKKLLLFLALWSGAASAMQSDTVPANVASATSAMQDQIDLTATVAEQASVLTADQRQQVVDKAAENIQKIVDSCGNDKELLKTTLQQKIKNLLTHPIAGPFAVTFFVCLEIAFTVAAFYGCLYGVNLLSILTTGKLLLATYPSISLKCFYLILGCRIGYGLGWISHMQNKPNGGIITQLTA
jgi:uncharacterized membrane protein